MPLKGILIVGKDDKGNHSIDNDFEVYKNNPDYLIIDASHELMTQEEFRAKLAEYEIDSNTRIDIWAHGSRVNEREDGSADHGISLLSDVRLTRDVLSIISESGGNKPIQAHLWSCYGGTAAKAVESLPEGSIVMGHGPEKSVTSLIANKKAINDSISAAIRNDTNRMSSVGQDLVNNMPSYIMQDLNIGLKGVNSEVERFHFDEASPNISEIESIRGLFTGYSKQIISAIGSMKERGLLPPEIELPVMKTYSEEEIKSYEFDRTLFDLFLRNGSYGRDSEEIDFSKIIRDGVLISQEDAGYLGLNEREKKLLDPEFQKVLLNARDIKGESYLLKLSGYPDDWKNRDGSIDYIIEIAKRNNIKVDIPPALLNNTLSVSKLINKGFRINLDELLETAVRNNNIDLFQFLVEKGADFRAFDKDGKSILEKAITYNNKDVVKILQNYELAPKEKILTEIFLGNIDYTPDILRHSSININDIRAEENTCLAIAINNKDLKTIKFLLQNGADPNLESSDESLLSLIMRDINRNIDLPINTEIAKSLIEFGANLNSGTIREEPVLHQLIRKEPELLELFHAVINKSTSESINEKIPSTPLYLACNILSSVHIETLLEKGANPNIPNKQGNIPLHALCIKNATPDLIKFLLDSGSDINYQNKNGSTPLHIACSKGNIEAVKLLLEYNADISLINNNSQTPLDIAIASNNREILEIFRNRENLRTQKLSDSIRNSLEQNIILKTRIQESKILEIESKSPKTINFKR